MRRKTFLQSVFLFAVFLSMASAEPARIHVFVALADNDAQGIAKVPAKIGNGDDPKNNLYWGCSEALPPVLRASRDWKHVSTGPGPKPTVLERAIFLHRAGKFEIVADAYRGTAISECIVDYFHALSSDTPIEALPAVVFMGHNGLMDESLPDEAAAKRGPGRRAAAVCCISKRYFAPHLEKVNATPALLTTQLMYPGGFLLREFADALVAGDSPERLRQRVAAAYARNQKISVKAAAGVFSTGD
jgi:hypothetical protein